MVKDFVFCLQEAALYFIFKKFQTHKDASECFVNPPCGCTNPGKNPQCEDCVYLEVCLSNCKLEKISLSSR
jgi:hypothetical protein